MLPRTGFLAEASDELARALESMAREVTLAPREVLFEQGDPGDALFAVVEGLLEISVLSEDGRKLSLDAMRPGALLGEIALFDPGPRTATATALEPTRLARVQNRDLMAAIRQAPGLGIDMIRLAGQRMRWMSDQINEQVFLPMPTRLARKLLYLVPETTDPGAALTMSQSELAEFVGATREAVSKMLGEWKRQNILAPTRRGIRILDRASLQLLARLDPV